MNLAVRKVGNAQAGAKNRSGQTATNQLQVKRRDHTNETETSRSADAAMFFGKDKERMPADCSKLENAGSLELSRVA